VIPPVRRKNPCGWGGLLVDETRFPELPMIFRMGGKRTCGLPFGF
jgi:hypothetical protein